MSEATEGIVQKLTAQRTLLMDVVRQIDTAIAVFSGTNGNGTATNGKPLHWTQRPENQRLVRRVVRKAQRTRIAKQRAEAPATVPAGF